MIKYIEFDSIDEYGSHIIPAFPTSGLIKTASGLYSPTIMQFLSSMKKDPRLYYVVINALGSYEGWGPNRNGDAFPEEGLTHVSLRTDMGTSNDYGYKTFEYYAKLYKHHVNKDPNKSFGDVVFSSWNPVIKRVELVVGIYRDRGANTIEAIENGTSVAVSMGCLTNPDYPILTVDGYVAIKDIKVGDLVFTHNAQWKRVTQVYRRKYTGKLYTFHFRGLSLPLELTADHPMMAKIFNRKESNKKRAFKDSQEYNDQKYEWGNAENISIGDCIKYQPVTYSPYEYASIDSIGLAKIMGYYLAEGNFGYNNGKPAYIQFSCHIDDDLPNELPKLINEYFPNTTCTIRPHQNSKYGLVVSVFSTRLSVFLEKYIGHLASKKKIPPEIFISSNEVKLAFMGAWLSGDGFCDNKGIHWSSCNVNLLLQARDLLISCGIASSLYKITHKAGSGFSFHDTREYTLNISHYDAEQFIPFASRKLHNLDHIIKYDRKRAGTTSIKFDEDGSYSYSIKDMSVREASDIQTYNFEVEDDESYVAAGLVSHNCKVKYDRCSICQNKAKSRSEYCIHLQNYLRQIVSREMADRWSRELGITILPGSAVMMFNDHPKFFDISEVYIGAERTAFVLGKAAHVGHVTPSIDIADAYGVTDNDIDKLSMIGKKSEIDKKIGGPDSLQDFDGQVVAVANKMKDKIDVTNLRVMADEPEINTSVLNSIAQAAPLSRVLSTMLGMGIQPKPREFQRIVLVSMGSSDIADALDKNNEIFDYTDEVEPIDLPIGSNGFDDCISRMLVGYVRDRSAYPEFLEPRFHEVMDKSASYAGDLTTNYWHQNAQGTGPLITQSNISPLALTLGGIAALYMGLKLRAAGYSTKVLADTFASKPWLQVLIGGSILARLMSKSRDLSSDDLLYTPASAYANVLQDTGLTGQMQKTGSLPNALGLGLLTSAVVLPGSYIMNSYNQKSLYQTGRPLFPGAGTEPRKAAILSGLAVGGGVLGYDKAKVLVRDAIKKGLLKIK